MKLSSVPQNLTEAVALALGVVPTPLIDTLLGFLLAKAVIAGTALGVFDALERGALPTSEISRRCKTDRAATERLLRALCGCRYLTWENNSYRLSRSSRRWLLRGRSNSLRSAILHRDLDLRFMQFETYLREGAIQHFHGALSPEDWEIYHDGQAGHAALTLDEVLRRVPLPDRATDFLDLGGGHGLYSFGFCGRYPRLRARVFDLDITYGSLALSKATETIRGRVSFHAEDIRHVRLPESSCDTVLMANVLHHFDEGTARKIVERIASALRPDGMFVVLDAVRPRRIDQSEQFESLLDLYFGAASGAGLWTIEGIRALQKDAGLTPSPTQALRLLPCCKLQCARKLGA
jgi:SAM-dependent methyltransferase